MNIISSLLPLTNILVDLDASSKKRAFEQVGLLFENQYGINRNSVYTSLFDREKLGSTGLGRGVAIPHGRLKGIKGAKGAFLRLLKPVLFDAPDNQPVGMMFVLLAPESANEKHLQLLSELAQIFSDDKMRTDLANATNAAEVHQLFVKWLPVTL